MVYLISHNPYTRELRIFRGLLKTEVLVARSEDAAGDCCNIPALPMAGSHGKFMLSVFGHVVYHTRMVHTVRVYAYGTTIRVWYGYLYHMRIAVLYYYCLQASYI